MREFLPKDYSVPKTQSNYLKFEQGQNKFRIVSSAIVGYEYWTDENKPVRVKEMPKQIPTNMRKDSKIKHFWAFTVLDRNDKRIKICELTQSTIQGAIKALVDNADWGDPKKYDITVTRTGESLETEYNIQPSPHKDLTEEEKQLVAETTVNLEALFTGENPFDSIPEVNSDLITDGI